MQKRQAYIQAYIHIDRQRGKHIHTDRNRQPYTNRLDKKTDRHRQTHRQAEWQADR